MTYGDKRDYRKIDISWWCETERYWHYAGTTTWAKTCKEAVAKWSEKHDPGGALKVRARFQK